MKKWAYAVAWLGLLVATSGGAYASCTLSNLDGAWRMYLWSGPGAAALWTKCTVEVGGGTGQVLANRVCENAAGTTFLTTGGQLSINDVCRVGGSIATEAGTIALRHSFLEANLNQIWTGVATNVDGVDTMFTGVRGLSTRGVGGDGGSGTNGDVRQLSINGVNFEYFIYEQTNPVPIPGKTCWIHSEATNTTGVYKTAIVYFDVYSAPGVFLELTTFGVSNLPPYTTQTQDTGFLGTSWMDGSGCSKAYSWQLNTTLTSVTP